MGSWIIRYGLRRIKSAMRRWRSGVLAEPLNSASDQAIDAALKRNGLRRADLFRPANAIARHRKRMAYMLAAWQIDVRRATEDHWPELKDADESCSRCFKVGRCQGWLEWAWPDTAPLTFCPNARLLLALAAEQTSAPRERGAARAGNTAYEAPVDGPPGASTDHRPCFDSKAVCGDASAASAQFRRFDVGQHTMPPNRRC